MTGLLFDAYLLLTAAALLGLGGLLAWPVAHRAGVNSVTVPRSSTATEQGTAPVPAGPAPVGVRRPGTHRLPWWASVALWWAVQR